MINNLLIKALKSLLFCQVLMFSFFSNAQRISKSPIGEHKVDFLDRNTDSTDFSSLHWREDKTLRTAKSAIYKAPGGWIRVEHNQQPIHRIVNGKWERIDPKMHQNTTNTWHASNQDFPIHLDNKGSFSLTTTSGNTWSLGSLSTIQNTAVVYQFIHRENNDFFFIVDDLPIEKEILALENAVKYNYRIDANLALTTSHLVFTERIVLPKGFFIEEVKQKQETIWGTRYVSVFYIKDGNKTIQGKIDPAYAVDANKGSHPADYELIVVSENEYDLRIMLSNQWLNAAGRGFPVILDPLVVGPISQWVGGQMPSCMSPQQNIDSILVTIPAGITPISLAVRSSFYADPWTGATMSMGAMQFSTSCNATQQYQIQGNDGNAPGTAFLDSANMLNPLLCCFQQSCSEQQFYLRKHLSRTAPGTGCNANFIRYDPFTTQWPFRAIVYGRTPETYAAEWSVPQQPRCANNCDFNATAYIRYGVPPFTLSHPWQDTVIIQGNAMGCNSGQSSVQFNLKIPDCPILCDVDYTALAVPNPSVIDACGVSVDNFPLRSLNIKPAPEINPIIDTVFCAGETLDFSFTNCLNAGSINWNAEGQSGESEVFIETDPGMSGVFVYNFLITSVVDGCQAEPYFQPVYVFPLPNVSFEVTSEDTFLGDLIDFQNTSTGVSLQGNDWLWDYGEGTTQIAVNGQHTFTDVGSFEVCLSLLGGESCANSFCKVIPVVPNAIDVPNVFSPNGDGTNDVLNLFFDWAEKVELTVLNRWGQIVASIVITDYDSGWNGTIENSGASVPEGVYFYDYVITTTVGGTLKGHSFVHLLRD